MLRAYRRRTSWKAAKPYLATLPGLILGCLVCCALWGSAFPCIKIGYGLFGIPAHDSASQLLFAGRASRLPVSWLSLV
ncbi:MAG: hypothetical protein ACLTYW_05190 [Collinsella sp.]